MLNRDLIVVRLKQLFVDWVNEADPYSDGSRMTLEEVNEELPTFLIHDEASDGNFQGQHHDVIGGSLMQHPVVLLQVGMHVRHQQAFHTIN